MRKKKKQKLNKYKKNKKKKKNVKIKIKTKVNQSLLGSPLSPAHPHEQILKEKSKCTVDSPIPFNDRYSDTGDDKSKYSVSYSNNSNSNLNEPVNANNQANQANQGNHGNQGNQANKGNQASVWASTSWDNAILNVGWDNIISNLCPTCEAIHLPVSFFVGDFCYVCFFLYR